MNLLFFDHYLRKLSKEVTYAVETFALTSLLYLKIQWKPLNEITLGLIKTDKINRMLTISNNSVC
jgi:hypothetical protein